MFVSINVFLPRLCRFKQTRMTVEFFIIKVSKYCKSFGAINELIFGMHFLRTYYNFFIVVMSS